MPRATIWVSALGLVTVMMIACGPRPDTAKTNDLREPNAEPVVFVEAAVPRSEPEQAATSARDQTAPAVGYADSPGEAVAKQLFMEGQQLFKQGDTAKALLLFEQAYVAAPLPALKYNIAHCLEQLGRAHEACDAYRVVFEQSTDHTRDAAAQARVRLGC